MRSSLFEIGDLDAESSWTAARVEEVMFQDLASQDDGSEESWFERITVGKSSVARMRMPTLPVFWS
jgi:hypothetical protein